MIIIGISFILIWLITTFFILRYIKSLKSDLLKTFSDTKKNSEEKVYKPFDYINGVDPERLLNFIHYEHPQVIALVLANLKPEKASVILRSVSQDVQSEVIHRIACMDMVSPEIIREIERVLEKKLCTLSGEAYSTAGGVESTVKILNLAGRDTENHIIKTLDDEDPELAEWLKNELKVLRKPCRKILGKLKRKLCS